MIDMPAPRPRSVLVVQREPDLIGLLLKREGFIVHTADDARSALHELARTVPEVVLVDWTLPDTDGVELCRQLKSSEATMRVPTVLMTGSDDLARRATARDAGARALLGRPFSRDKLMNCVLSAIHGGPQQD